MHDEKALSVVTALGIILALTAIFMAAWAEYKRESTLYLSAGLISGSGSLILWNTYWGLFFLLIGTGAVAAVRHRALATPDFSRDHPYS